MTRFKKIGIFSFTLLVAIMSIFAFIPNNNISVNAASFEPGSDNNISSNVSSGLLYESNDFNVGSTFYDLASNGYKSIRSGSLIRFWVYGDKIVIVNMLYSGVNTQTNPEDIKIYSINYLTCYRGSNYSGLVGLDRDDSKNRKHKFYLGATYFSSNDFDFNNLSYILVNFEYTFGENSHKCYTHFKIYDVNYNYFHTSIEFNSMHSVDGFNVNNTFYSTMPIYRNEKFLIGANSSYDLGYSQGYSEGLNSSSNKGYQEGYNLGKNEGYNNGYNQAMSDSDSYSFTKLITSVVDAPIHVITSMFNFEFMGVNLTSFFMGLITFCVVIFVIRLILGGMS